MALSREEIAQIVDEIAQTYKAIPADKRIDYQEHFLRLLQDLEPHIVALEQAAQLPPELPVVQATDISRELWTLARGNPDIFSAYASSYPDRALNAVASNPAELNALIQRLGSAEIEPRGEVDGIRAAPLKSSNVFGYRYDPLKKRLAVRFHSGSIYRYDGVPPIIFDMFRHGEGTARTTGSNRFGRWWRGKNPSLSAALNQLIKIGGYPYTRIR